MSECVFMLFNSFRLFYLLYFLYTPINFRMMIFLNIVEKFLNTGKFAK